MTKSVIRYGTCLAVALCTAWPALATTLITQDTNGLVRGSSDIVVGRVATVWAHWDDSHQHIVTDVVIDVSESLKGANQRLVLTQLGGEVDGYRLTVPGCPTFKPGEEALLFVWRDARGKAQLNGLGQGKFEIRSDARTQERYLVRSLPGMGFADARTLRPLSAGEKAPRTTLKQMLGVIRADLAKSDR